MDEVQQLKAQDVPVATAMSISGSVQGQQHELKQEEQHGALFHVDAKDQKSHSASLHLGIMFICMGTKTRRTRWVPPRKMTAVGVMGGVELDFTNAEFVHRVCKVNVVAIMGGVKILVPPGVHVINNGIGVCGGFCKNVEFDGGSVLDKPTIILRGAAVLGGACAKTDMTSHQVRVVRQAQ